MSVSYMKLQAQVRVSGSRPEEWVVGSSTYETASVQKKASWGTVNAMVPKDPLLLKCLPARESRMHNHAARYDQATRRTEHKKASIGT